MIGECTRRRPTRWIFCEIIVKKTWFTHLTSFIKLQCGHAASSLIFASSCGALLFSSRLEMLEVSSCAAAKTAIWRTRMHAAIIQFFAGAIRMRFLFFLIVRTLVLSRFTLEIAAEMGMNWMLIGNYLAHVITWTTQRIFPETPRHVRRKLFFSNRDAMKFSGKTFSRR